ncbi:uncharacterized protein LOC144632588 [Oculina patagonica]
MKTEVLFGRSVRNSKHSPLIDESFKPWTPSMASERKLHNQNSLKSQRKLSRVNSFAKDEDLEKILQDIETINKYKPSSKTAKKRPSVTDDGGLPPDEELDMFFVDVEKRNAELQELLQAVESTREESEEQLSRIASAGERGSTDSLVEKLMQELDCVGCEKDNSNRTKEMQKSSNKATKERTFSKLEASASEEELDQMLAELLEL